MYPFIHLCAWRATSCHVITWIDKPTLKVAAWSRSLNAEAQLG